jgi:hypothetical protein
MYKVYYGGWYQRTTLHLSEVYDFLKSAKTNLPLDINKLNYLRESLNLDKVTRENDYLEYVSAHNGSDIDIRYFEDGLYLLSTDSEDIEKTKIKLEKYYENYLGPAISYIFSLGAPTPKVLANIKNSHPLVVVLESKKHSTYDVDTTMFGEVYSSFKSDKFSVYKTPNYIIIAVEKSELKKVSSLVEMQIFFREFKDQLEKYLNIHRTIWEEITLIKDMGSVKGRDIVKNRMKLDSYERSINLINNRINQMSTYVKTRQSISKELGIEDHLGKVFDYKFETLVNTLTYIKEVWAMTKDYVKNALSVLSDIENQSLNNSIKSLQIITSIGVVSGIFGYISKTDLPKVTNQGWKYLAILLVTTFIINVFVSIYYKNIKYKIKISDTSKEI